MTQIQHRLIRSRRRTMALQVTNDAELVVRAPQRLPLQDIHSFIEKNLSWIQKRQRIAREALSARGARQFANGEKFLYLGEERPLFIAAASNRELSFDMLGFLLGEKRRAEAPAQFENWYRAQALSVLTERVRYFSERSGLRCAGIKISNALSRWGSCSPEGKINFSWRLVMAPLWVVDYVVAHELAHLVHHNHSARFWKKVSELFPNFKEARRWLRTHQHLITI